MDALRSARQKRISRKQEKSAAADLGGQTQAASGATRLGGGGDVRAPGYRIECKYTEKDQYSLKRADLHKLKLQAARTLEQPVLQLAFVDTLGRRTEFAIVKAYGAATNLVKDKSILLIHEQVVGLIRVHADKYKIRFDGDRECWHIRHWFDFVETKE